MKRYQNIYFVLFFGALGYLDIMAISSEFEYGNREEDIHREEDGQGVVNTELQEQLKREKGFFDNVKDQSKKDLLQNLSEETKQALGAHLNLSDDQLVKQKISLDDLNKAHTLRENAQSSEQSLKEYLDKYTKRKVTGQSWWRGKASSQKLVEGLMDNPSKIPSEESLKNLIKELDSFWGRDFEQRMQNIAAILNEAPKSPAAKAIVNYINKDGFLFHKGEYFSYKVGDLNVSMKYETPRLELVDNAWEFYDYRKKRSEEGEKSKLVERLKGRIKNYDTKEEKMGKLLEGYKELKKLEKESKEFGNRGYTDVDTEVRIDYLRGKLSKGNPFTSEEQKVYRQIQSVKQKAPKDYGILEDAMRYLNENVEKPNYYSL